MTKNKKLSLRETFHKIGNYHCSLILGTGMVKREIEETLKTVNLTQEQLDLFQTIIIKLKYLEKVGKAAAGLLKLKVKPPVYERLRVDEIQVEVEEELIVDEGFPYKKEE